MILMLINRDLKKFCKLIKETSEKSKKKGNSGGPGVLEHRVTPVTKGIRYSLVTWFLGPPYV